MALVAPAPRVLADVVPHTWVRQIALVLGGAAFVGIAAQVIIPLPFTPVPLTLSTFAVLLASAALGTARAVIAMSIYALAGIAGVPWFAGGNSGLTVPTFGYILGFIAAAFVVGRLAESGATRSVWRTTGLMIVGSLVIYAFGVTWLAFSINVPFVEALTLGMVPFLIGDAIKIAAAAGLLPLAWLGVRKFMRSDS
jgi:biotin transport system substrate-specific component